MLQDFYTFSSESEQYSKTFRKFVRENKYIITHADYPESNRYPDFVFSYQQSHCFAVECKWRERLTANIEKDLFSTDKLAIYQQFADERRMPVLIVLGVGGEPCQPELLYIIPLNEIPSIINKGKSIVAFLRPSVESPFKADEFLTQLFQRNNGAITSRLRKLGMIK